MSTDNLVELIKKAYKEVREIYAGANLFQPGFAKELIISLELGHKLIINKKDADAKNPNDERIKYEYLTCEEGKNWQLANFNIGTSDSDKDNAGITAFQKSINKRVTRSEYFYLVNFSKDLEITNIYEINSSEMVHIIECIKKKKRKESGKIHISFSLAEVNEFRHLYGKGDDNSISWITHKEEWQRTRNLIPPSENTE